MVDRRFCVSLKDRGCSDEDKDDEGTRLVLYLCLSNGWHAPSRPALNWGPNPNPGSAWRSHIKPVQGMAFYLLRASLPHDRICLSNKKSLAKCLRFIGYLYCSNDE